MTTKYDVGDEFSDGYCAALKVEGIDNSKSEHWHAGYSAGYAARKQKNDAMNAYLVSIGEEPMGVVRLT